MRRALFWLAAVCTMVCLSAGTARAQTLTLEVELADLETFINNGTGSAIPVNLYGLRSPSPIFDRASWRSISDSAAADPAAVSATLGSGALSFSEFITRPDWLIEVSFSSFAVWQPGARWSIGFPFGTSPDTFDPSQIEVTFRYGTSGAETVDGQVVFVPVPEPGAMSIAALALVWISLAARKRPRCARVSRPRTTSRPMVSLHPRRCQNINAPPGRLQDGAAERGKSVG